MPFMQYRSQTIWGLSLMSTQFLGRSQTYRGLNLGFNGNVLFNCNINIFNICFKSRIQSPKERRLNILEALW